jgi:hypothetical protein
MPEIVDPGAYNEVRPCTDDEIVIKNLDFSVGPKSLKNRF